MSPETVVDPTTQRDATLAVDPALARRLVARAVTSPAGAPVTTRSPLTGAPITTLPSSTVEDVDRAFALARAAQPGWAATGFRQRAGILLRLHDLMLDRQAELIDLIQIESGKMRWNAFEEVGTVALGARYYARSARHHLRTRRRAGTVPVLTRTTERHHPLGVVGIVSPWNYPLAMSVEDVIPALMAGNAVVLRPDLQAALTALSWVELLDEAGLPRGVLQVVLGDGPTTGQAVVDRGDYVSFTGSTQTGRVIAESLAGRLVGYSLELGGKNALYIADDADLDRAIPGAVNACFSSAGQMCISIERIAVHERVAEEFIPRFVAAVRAMRVGVELAYGADMGSLVSQRQVDKVRAHLDDALAQGATVLTGGNALPDIGPFCFEPTVLTDVTPQMRVHAEETFGPVVSIYVVPSDEGAISLANDSEHGLNASVWTRDTRRGEDIAARIQSGTVNVNEAYAAAYGSLDAPMGGMKSSGVGRRHGRQGILKYTETQTVAVQRWLPVGPSHGVDPEAYARWFTTGLRLLKAVGAR